MTDFSQPPQQVLDANRGKGFVGIHIMQGVPILDRDLNLLQDLISSTVRSIISRYIGSGVPVSSDAFQIKEDNANNDFQITVGSTVPGLCLVNGIEVSIEADVKYSAQVPAPTRLSTPGGAARTDLVYLDVFLETVDDDELLTNEDDIAVQTSTRLRPAWMVRVAEDVAAEAIVPPGAASPGHAYFALARLARKPGNAKITAAMITDLRTRCLTLNTVLETLVLPQLAGFADGNGDPTTEAQPNGILRIVGRNLDLFGPPKVLVGNIAVDATKVKVLSPSTVQITVPTGLSDSVDVVLTNGAGSAKSPKQLEIVL